MKQIIMFPGQGSQKTGMGIKLLDFYTDLVQEADRLLGYSVRKIITEEESLEQLNQTRYTQPLLYLVNGLTWLYESEQNGLAGDLFIGHSLGEYNALQAAGVFDLITGLKLVQKRAALMADLGTDRGGMVAVLGLEDHTVMEGIKGVPRVSVANYNSRRQVVLSGDKQSLSSLIEPLQKMGARKVVMLPVSGAFHSEAMREVAQHFADFLDSFHWNSPTHTVYSNVDGKPYGERSIKEMLVRQIYSSVQWRKTIEAIKASAPCQFTELGPGRVLTGLVKRI